MTLTRFDETTQVKDLAAGLNANADVIEPHLTALNPHPQGRLSRTVSGGQDVTLTAEQARHTQLVFTGVLTGNINVIVPAAHMVYHVQNLTTNLLGAGPFSLTLKTGSGSGVVIQQASLPDHPRIKRVLCDGTDIVWADGGQIAEDNLHETAPTNGYYVVYASGLKRCFAEVVPTYTAITRCATTWTYPVPFTRKPIVQLTINADSASFASTQLYDIVGQVDQVTTTSARCSIRKVIGGANFVSGDSCPVYVTAEGY